MRLYFTIFFLLILTSCSSFTGNEKSQLIMTGSEAPTTKDVHIDVSGPVQVISGSLTQTVQ